MNEQPYDYRQAINAPGNDIHHIEVKDNVNHPPHYTSGKVECIDAIESSMTTDAFRGYCKGNIIKYLYRYEKKNGMEDLKKARWYLDKLITTY